MAAVAGAWSAPQAVALAPDQAWLRSPLRPELDLPVYVREIGDERLGRAVGVFRPLGSTDAITVSDVRQSGEYTVTFGAATAAGRQALVRLLSEGGTLLLTQPTEHDEPGTHDYLSPVGEISIDRTFQGWATATAKVESKPHRMLTSAFVRVARP